MAVERLTDYTRRIWTGLSADGPDPDMQAGDVIYYMDTSKCSIITGIPTPGSIDTADLPDIGGGGGGPVMGTVNPVNYDIIIPKVPDKQNFMFCVSDPDSEYFSGGGRLIVGVHPRWYYTSNLYFVKNTNAVMPPTAVSGAVRTASSSDDSSITYKFNNNNTTGLMPNGYTVTYIWW